MRRSSRRRTASLGRKAIEVIWLYVCYTALAAFFLAVLAFLALETFNAHVKPKITPPCVECRSHVKVNGLHMCAKVVSEVDGRPLLCSFSRDGFRCRFERKDGEQ